MPNLKTDSNTWNCYVCEAKIGLQMNKSRLADLANMVTYHQHQDDSSSVSYLLLIPSLYIVQCPIKIKMKKTNPSKSYVIVYISFVTQRLEINSYNMYWSFFKFLSTSDCSDSNDH